MGYKKYLSALVLCTGLLSPKCWAIDGKDDKQNSKAVEKEEKEYQKSLRKHPNDAKTYWQHANNLAAVNTEYKRAGEFYRTALKFDSLNAGIYADYGKYLYERARALEDAKEILTKACKLDGNNENTKVSLAAVNKELDAREAEIRKWDFGHKTLKLYDSTIKYTNVSAYDSLRNMTTNPSSNKYYPKLLDRFLSNDSTLTPEEMFFMILGYSKQATYSPFNTNDIMSVKMFVSHNLDSAIARGNEVAKTNPLNPTLNREIMHCYRLKNDTVMANKFKKRIQQFFDGVIYSGNGSCAHPYIALWGKEETKFIEYIGYSPTTNKSMGTCGGQMAEMVEITDPQTNKNLLMHFNLALIYQRELGK